MGVIVPNFASSTEDRASGALVIDGSLRFAQSNTQYLTRTPGSNGDRTRWTVSLWCKRHSLGGGSGGLRSIIHTNAGSQETILAFWSDDAIFFWDYNSAYTTQLKTVGVAFRDISSWYHIVLSVDTTQSTDTERIKLYVNNVRQIFTNVAPHGYIAQNTQTRWNSALSSRISGDYYINDCSITNIYNIDGQALDPSYFGFTDPLTNTWRPKKLSSSVAFGTNGFYLPLDGNTPIGQDQSGRGNNWTPVNFGGSNTLEKATGALPILNTDGGGKVARVGVRTDSNASSLVLALPLVGIKSDFSNKVNSGATEKAITANGAVATSSYSNFYGGSFDCVGNTSTKCLDIADSADFAFASGDALTVEAWIWLDSNYTSGGIFQSSQQKTGGLSDAWFFRVVSGGLSWGMHASTTHTTPSSSIPNNTWTHVAICRNTSNVWSAYVNGVSQTLSGSVSATLSKSGTGAMVGQWCEGSGTNRPLNGYIQDFRLYKGVAKYTQNFIPASTDPDILPDTPSGVAYSSNVALVPSTDGAVAFGSGRVLTTTSSADFNFGTGDFTIEYFLYRNSLGSNDAALTNYSQVSSGYFMCLHSNSTDAYLLLNGSTVTSGGTAEARKWIHYAYVRSGTTCTIYKNGISIASATSSAQAGATNVMNIGAYSDGSSFIDGFISNLHIVKGTALYTSNFTPPTAPITSVANTKLLCCKSQTSATAFDVSPGTITANGNAVASNFNPFTVNINTQRGQESGYCTLNPLTQGSNSSLSNGNLNYLRTSNGYSMTRATISVSSGKWYYEHFFVGSQNNAIAAGIVPSNSTATYPGEDANSVGYNFNGTKVINTTQTSYGATYDAGDVVGVAFDADNGTVNFYKNGINQGTATSALTSGPYTVGVSGWGSGTGSNMNFGQKPFKFPPPAGFQPLALANTPRPTIVRPDQYVGIVTYTGNGATRSLDVGFKPDFSYFSVRSGTGYIKYIFDSVRGATKYLATSHIQGTNAEGTDTETLKSFDRNGVTIGNNAQMNESSANTWVSWHWKAGGNSNTYNINDVGYATASAAGLTAGTITPTGASVNTKSGFSIITYTGTGANATISHGLGNAPSMLIVKSRSTSGESWIVYHSGAGLKYGALNLTNAFDPNVGTIWNSTAPSSTVFSIGTNTAVNGNTTNYVAYLWAEIPGFSKFGSYTGNQSTDGPVITTGFRPRWIMLKASSVGGTNYSWYIYDTSRDTYNITEKFIQAETNAAESTGFYFDILSNGFKVRTNSIYHNSSGATYVYAAFAETPSFNLYGGQSNAR